MDETLGPQLEMQATGIEGQSLSGSEVPRTIKTAAEHVPKFKTEQLLHYISALIQAVDDACRSGVVSDSLLESLENLLSSKEEIIVTKALQLLDQLVQALQVSARPNAMDLAGHAVHIAESLDGNLDLALLAYAFHIIHQLLRVPVRAQSPPPQTDCKPLFGAAFSALVRAMESSETNPARFRLQEVDSPAPLHATCVVPSLDGPSVEPVLQIKSLCAISSLCEKCPHTISTDSASAILSAGFAAIHRAQQLADKSPPSTNHLSGSDSVASMDDLEVMFGVLRKLQPLCEKALGTASTQNFHAAALQCLDEQRLGRLRDAYLKDTHPQNSLSFGLTHPASRSLTMNSPASISSFDSIKDLNVQQGRSHSALPQPLDPSLRAASQPPLSNPTVGINKAPGTQTGGSFLKVPEGLSSFTNPFAQYLEQETAGAQSDSREFQNQLMTPGTSSELEHLNSANQKIQASSMKSPLEWTQSTSTTKSDYDYKLAHTPSTRIWLGNIAAHVTMDAVMSTFSQFGPLKDAAVYPSRIGPLGFGFLNFVHLEDAIRAHSTLNNTNVPQLTGSKFLKMRYKPAQSYGGLDRLNSQSALNCYSNASAPAFRPALPTGLRQYSLPVQQATRLMSSTGLDLGSMPSLSLPSIASRPPSADPGRERNFSLPPAPAAQLPGQPQQGLGNSTHHIPGPASSPTPNPATDPPMCSQPESVIPALNLSNRLNPNNMHFDKQLAQYYKNMSKMEKEALWQEDRNQQRLLAYHAAQLQALGGSSLNNLTHAQATALLSQITSSAALNSVPNLSASAGLAQLALDPLEGLNASSFDTLSLLGDGASAHQFGLSADQLLAQRLTGVQMNQTGFNVLGNQMNGGGLGSSHPGYSFDTLSNVEPSLAHHQAGGLGYSNFSAPPAASNQKHVVGGFQQTHPSVSVDQNSLRFLG